MPNEAVVSRGRIDNVQITVLIQIDDGDWIRCIDRPHQHFGKVPSPIVAVPNDLIVINKCRRHIEVTVTVQVPDIDVTDRITRRPNRSTIEPNAGPAILEPFDRTGRCSRQQV